MSMNDPLRRRRIALGALAEDELPAEYYDRAAADLMKDENEQRDFVNSEFLNRGAIRAMIGGTRAPHEVARDIELDFAAWLRRERQFRLTTMAWALYANDHPNARRD